MIGHISIEQDARTFGDFLYVRGIDNLVEADRDGSWVIWVHNEDQLEEGKRQLARFTTNPGAAEYREAAAQARAQRKQQATEEIKAAKRTFDADDVFNRKLLWGMTRLTAVLVIMSVGIWLVLVFSENRKLLGHLFISNFFVDGGPLERWKHGLVEVRRGEIWRLISPIFVHDLRNFLHILLNMLWLRDLGTMIEIKNGPRFLLLLVLVIGMFSNLAQYYVTGPAFGGMSGVVYGLLGYIWIKGKFDPGSGFFLHPTTVAMMLIWLAFGYTNILPIANTVHTVGLATGMFWGYVSAIQRR